MKEIIRFYIKMKCKIGSIFLIGMFALLIQPSYSQQLSAFLDIDPDISTYVANWLLTNSIILTVENNIDKSQNFCVTGFIIDGSNRIVATFEDRSGESIFIEAFESITLFPAEFLELNEESIRDEYLTFFESTGQLLPGNYQVCINLLLSCEFSEGPMCERLTLSCDNPLLSFPEDNATLTMEELALTTFEWIHDGSIEQEFAFVLAEIYSGQSPAEAIRNNLPVFEQSISIDNQLFFPADLVMPPGNYAWSVAACDDQLGENAVIFQFKLLEAEDETEGFTNEELVAWVFDSLNQDSKYRYDYTLFKGEEIDSMIQALLSDTLSVNQVKRNAWMENIGISVRALEERNAQSQQFKWLIPELQNLLDQRSAIIEKSFVIPARHYLFEDNLETLPWFVDQYLNKGDSLYRSYCQIMIDDINLLISAGMGIGMADVDYYSSFCSLDEFFNYRRKEFEVILSGITGYEIDSLCRNCSGMLGNFPRYLKDSTLHHLRFGKNPLLLIFLKNDLTSLLFHRV